MTAKRAIFKEASAGEASAGNGRADGPRPGGIARHKSGARRAVRLWLMLVFALVALMVLVGGLTRLTDSGLSITDWKPIMGAVPPMGHSGWQQVFAEYQKSPEYMLQNKGMSLSAFKLIYWWEWSHRQLGRVIGLVWAFGFFGFLLSKRIPAGWTGRLFGLGVLGGFQGAIGWWMVSSGLHGRMVDVASYRLATHLGIAFIILGLCVWFIAALGRSEGDLMRARRVRETGLLRGVNLLMVVLFLQVLLGALVAGIDAGTNYIDWPWMAGKFVPDGIFALSPWWRNFFENMALVQFNHRMLGYLVVIVALVLWQRSRRSPNPVMRRALRLVGLMALVQMGLGIATVMSAAQPGLASPHQAGAIVLWALVLRARFLTVYPVATSIKGIRK